MKLSNLVTVLSSLLLCPTTCRASVLCGGHFADTCRDCPPDSAVGDGGESHCNGVCQWQSDTKLCDGPEVSCGNLNAFGCARCPIFDGVNRGASYCNGDCAWVDGQCNIKIATEVDCGTNGGTAATCDQCPSDSYSCTSDDCTWHTKTSLCRDVFSDEVRTATVHLNYDAPTAGGSIANPAWWFNRVIPTSLADQTYFATNVHSFGYGGIQRINETTGRILFSIWDQNGCDTSMHNTCNPNDVATVIACGTGVTCESFGGEGTGKKAYMDVDSMFPARDEEYFFVTQASYKGKYRMEHTGYFYMGGKWMLLARIQVSTNINEDWSLTGLSSFVEQWSPNDTTQSRGALFGPSYMAPEDGSNWHQITRAVFSHGTEENHERVNAFQDNARNHAVGIETGGNTVQVANRYETFDYPVMVNLYASLSIFGGYVTCLNRATTQSEIEMCFPSNYGQSSVEDTPTITPVEDTPTVTPKVASTPSTAFKLHLEPLYIYLMSLSLFITAIPLM